MENRLPQGFFLRAPTPDDAQAVTDLIGACDTFDYGEPDFSLEDVRADWRRDGFVLARDAWLIYAPDGTLAAYGFVWDMGEHARVEPTTCVHPNYREQGIEDFHLARVEAHTRAQLETKTIQWIVNDAHKFWTERLEQRGYHTTRHDYVMEIMLNEIASQRADAGGPSHVDSRPTAPLLANGFVMRSFERGRDDRLVWMCLQEAFRDHRGHHDLEFEEWASKFFAHPEWSPELSTVVMQGAECAAAAMVFHSFAGGWISTLGVRRPWRKQGIGLAMLHRIFAECYARGIVKIGLGVDAESLTGATRLYERAGMQIKVHFVRYEKEMSR